MKHSIILYYTIYYKKKITNKCDMLTSSIYNLVGFNFYRNLFILNKKIK